MSWLNDHATTILTYWGAVWALASVLQGVPISWVQKACHVVLALSPGDFVKAIKTVGAGVVPPVAGACLILLVRCTPAQQATASNDLAKALTVEQTVCLAANFLPGTSHTVAIAGCAIAEAATTAAEDFLARIEAARATRDAGGPG
jgi:hypothetical protein